MIRLPFETDGPICPLCGQDLTAETTHPCTAASDEEPVVA
jgi:hypothetical protein